MSKHFNLLSKSVSPSEFGVHVAQAQHCEGAANQIAHAIRSHGHLMSTDKRASRHLKARVVVLENLLTVRTPHGALRLRNTGISVRP
jgi:hypothetical protein